MTITPETKDWTWTILEACTDCGYDGPSADVAKTGNSIRALIDPFVAVLAKPNVAVRPNPDTWSPLEYACHVRDVFRLYEYRLGLMLAQDNPTYPNWDQDASAVEDRYDLQDPANVADELATAGHSLANAFDQVAGSQWERTGIRSDNKKFTVATFATYLVHDPYHHLWDITR
jgi:hypothetical protein